MAGVKKKKWLETILNMTAEGEGWADILALASASKALEQNIERYLRNTCREYELKYTEPSLYWGSAIGYYHVKCDGEDAVIGIDGDIVMVRAEAYVFLPDS